MTDLLLREIKFFLMAVILDSWFFCQQPTCLLPRRSHNQINILFIRKFNFRNPELISIRHFFSKYFFISIKKSLLSYNWMNLNSLILFFSCDNRIFPIFLFRNIFMWLPVSVGLHCWTVAKPKLVYPVDISMAR